MDEICFRLNSQMEALQIESSSAIQSAYKWLLSLLAQGQKMFQQICSSEHISQYINDCSSFLLLWYQRVLEHLQYQLSCAQLNCRDLYRQLGSLISGDVSKRDVAFCMAGLAVGGFIGYNIGLNWRHHVKRIHYMKAIICHHYIGIDGVSVIDDAEIPTLHSPNELLVQIKAASVNQIDAKICLGYSRAYRRLLNSGKELPVILGRDASGIVLEIGQNVVGFDVGDEVFLAVPVWAPGSMAEYLVINESQVAKKPKLISFEASACLPYSGCIAWNALVNESAVDEGNAKGKRILVCGGATPVGCILIQLVKLWGGHVSVVCRLDAVKVVRAIGADDVFSLNDCDVEKELQVHERYHAIFYTGGQAIDQKLLKTRLKPHGSFVNTTPESLASDSFGFISGSIFAGYVRIKLLLKYMFGSNDHYQWNEGSKIKTSYLDILRDLVDADELQSVVGAAFRPNHIEQALHHVQSVDAIGSTIIKFQ